MRRDLPRELATSKTENKESKRGRKEEEDMYQGIIW